MQSQISKLKIVIVNGRPRAGKTTFESMCQQILGRAYCERRSTVDKIKEIATEGGWKGGKELKDRKFLSDLKDLFTEYNDMSLEDIVRFARGWEDDLAYYGVLNHPHVLFVDDREPEHIERLRRRFNNQAITLLIRRPGDDEVETSNHADEGVFDYDYDYIIYNDGSIHKLYDEAQRFLNSIFSEF